MDRGFGIEGKTHGHESPNRDPLFHWRRFIVLGVFLRFLSRVTRFPTQTPRLVTFAFCHCRFAFLLLLRATAPLR
jgi:hypothetical protein